MQGEHSQAGIRGRGIQLPGDQNFSEIVHHLSDEVGSDGLIFTKVHSQGGMVLDNFRQSSTLDGQVSSRVAMKMDVSSYGSARVLSRSDYRNAINFISERDMVPFAGNPMNYSQALVQPRNDTFFLKSRGLPFLDHGFESKTYQEANKLVDAEIRGNLRSPS